MKDNSTFSISDICEVALFTALVSVLAQISIPLPGGVPLTMQTMAVLMTGIVLGSKRGCAALCAYLLLGALGVPVFSNFGAGLSRLVGPTGGFLLSYPLMAWIIGVCAEHGGAKLIPAGLAAATLINYCMGTLMYVFSTGNSIAASLAACVLPFIGTDILKAALAGWMGFLLKRALSRAGLIRRLD